MLALSTISIFSFLDAGFTPTIKNRLTEAAAQHDRQVFVYYASGSLTLAAFIAALSLLLSIASLFVDWSALIPKSSAILPRECRLLVAAIILTTLLAYALSPIESIFVAQLELSLVQILQAISSIIALGLTFLAVGIRASLPTLALTVSLPSIISRLFLLVLLFFRDPAIADLRLRKLPRLFRDLFPSSFFFMAIQFTQAIISALPNLFLIRLFSLSDISTFNVATRLVCIPRGALAALMPVFWPVFTIAWKDGDKQWLKKNLNRLLILTFGIFLFFTLLYTFFGPRLILFWTNGHIVATNCLLCILGLWVSAEACSYWLSTFLHSITDLAYQVLCYTFTIALFLFAPVLYNVNANVLAIANIQLLATLFATVFLLFRLRKHLG
jgi:O-antigen/teichoic acid export membrane protein